MALPIVTVNYTAVLVAAIASFALGALWYGPLFGKQWMKMMNITKDRMKKMGLSPAKAMSLGFVVALLVSYVLAHFVQYLQATTISEGLQAAFWLWLGFSAPLLFGSFLWEGKSLKLFAFNAAYRLVELGVMAAVLVAMA